jgi:hypothetical protein
MRLVTPVALAAAIAFGSVASAEDHLVLACAFKTGKTTFTFNDGRIETKANDGHLGNVMDATTYLDIDLAAGTITTHLGPALRIYSSSAAAILGNMTSTSGSTTMKLNRITGELQLDAESPVSVSCIKAAADELGASDESEEAMKRVWRAVEEKKPWCRQSGFHATYDCRPATPKF